jgi:glycosyltransferase involved in cell wall biosynthesis
MGGIEVIADELAAALAARGHTVTHLSSTAGGAASGLHGYRVVRVPALNVAERRLGIPYPVFGPRLVTTLREEVRKADVVHAHGYLYMGTQAAFAVGRRAPASPGLVLTEHVGHVPYPARAADLAERAAIRVLGRHALKAADAVITYNDRVREELAATVSAERLHTILNGVDHERFRSPSAAERASLRSELGWDPRPRVLFIGRPVAKKRFDVALEAVQRLDGKALLAVAGPERLPPGADAHAEALGPLARDRLAEVMRASDALIAPARGEGFPLAVQEGMASGLPVLLADDEGYAPNIDGAGEGVRVISGGAEEFATGLKELLADPASRERAGAAAAAHAQLAFSWERAAEQHELLYGAVTPV